MKESLEGLKVLVVEDEAMIAMLIEDMLLEFGCSMVGPASDIEQAFAVIAESNFDVAVLDVNLAGERTMPLAAALREKSIPFVFATGYGASGIGEDFKDRPFLTKPFRETDLRAALRNLIDS